MRKELAKNEGERRKFTAVFVRLGSKANYHGYPEETVLVKNVVDLENNQVVADHVWFSYTKSFQGVTLTEGIKVEFEARIKVYVKGYFNTRYRIDRRKEDYKLSHPTRVKTIQS